MAAPLVVRSVVVRAETSTEESERDTQSDETSSRGARGTDDRVSTKAGKATAISEETTSRKKSSNSTAKATATTKATRKTLQNSKAKDKSAMPTSGYLMVFAVVVLIAGGVGYWYYRKKHKVVQEQESVNEEEAEMQRQWEEEQKEIPDPHTEAQAGQYVEHLPYDEKSVFHPQGDSDAEEGDDKLSERRSYLKKPRRNRSLDSISQTSESSRGSEREPDRETVKSSHKSKSSKSKSKGKSRSSSKDRSKNEGKKKKKKKHRHRPDEREESGMAQQHCADPYPSESDAYDLGAGYHAHGQGSVPWIPDGRYTPASEMPTQQAATFAQTVGSYR